MYYQLPATSYRLSTTTLKYICIWRCFIFLPFFYLAPSILGQFFYLRCRCYCCYPAYNSSQALRLCIRLSITFQSTSSFGNTLFSHDSHVIAKMKCVFFSTLIPRIGCAIHFCSHFYSSVVCSVFGQLIDVMNVFGFDSYEL